MDGEFTIPELTEVVARLAALLGPRAGAVVQLEGGITNRNFRVNFGGMDYVVRLPGKRTQLLGINREAECIANKAAAKLGIAPRVAALLDNPSALVTAFISGREMTAEELREPEALAEVAHGLRLLHDSDTELPTGFDSFRLVEQYADTGREHGSEPPAEYEDALAAAGRIEKAVRDRPEHEPVPAHNDLLTANFLRENGHIQLIDWEYAGMGDRWFDLGNFAVNNGLDEDQEAALLEAYFGEPPDERRSATLKLFRFMSDFREAMWGLVQSGIAELDFDFSGYSRKHFERLAQTRDDPRFDDWLKAARG
ncbi:MAG TPA: choline/ethanolamine kinase family protein [Thermoleophilaceae bacterium]|jgi:thiamine kinase-like enzyme|nr:choline/ethanolamine kinase family protein [Thermoleophilaceae bacterium]